MGRPPSVVAERSTLVAPVFRTLDDAKVAASAVHAAVELVSVNLLVDQLCNTPSLAAAASTTIHTLASIL